MAPVVTAVALATRQALAEPAVAAQAVAAHQPRAALPEGQQVAMARTAQVVLAALPIQLAPLAAKGQAVAAAVQAREAEALAGMTMIRVAVVAAEIQL